MPSDSADSTKPNFSKEFPAIQDLVACPACAGALRLDADKLFCADCGREYSVVDGIPVLTPQHP